MIEKQVKLAVIGVGTMGSSHARDIASIPKTQLVAVCDLISDRAEEISQKFGCAFYTNYQDMLDNIELDGVIIATPHEAHTPISIDCLQRGIHVLTEKPLAVHVLDGEKMRDAYQIALSKNPDLKFGIMFQQRTFGYWKSVKELLEKGILGKIMRVTWIITDWFRTQTYYDNGGWRASWRGEGGGVLLNQCPHNLDLLQWFVGMPEKIYGFAKLGKYHNIEVEDEVTAYFEYANGAIGHFITSTAESPGTNRLEITAEMGKLVVEKEKITFWHNKSSSIDEIQFSPNPYNLVENEEKNISFTHHGTPGHRLMIENFANAILYQDPLIAPAIEGLNQLQLSNAIMLSSFLNQPVEIPIDAVRYKNEILERVKNSRIQTIKIQSNPFDASKSFR
ncbi:MAG: oxidoreductase [Chloroflexi bacterium HGW-Chloroflexi-8]|nr:MAG: oxidoreductase [Chloroflexi bacterium HGW-Chloroflexi-8]